jgi:hypothetical protein
VPKEPLSELVFEGEEESPMPNGFKNKKSAFWLAGIALLVVGFLVAAIVLPMNTPTPGAGGPDVTVPRMENVPSEGAPKMKLDVEKKEP